MTPSDRGYITTGTLASTRYTEKLLLLLTPEQREKIKALANEHHGGNVSAAIRALIERARAA